MSGIVACVCWVGKGVSKEIPDKVKLSEEELASLIKTTQDTKLSDDETDKTKGEPTDGEGGSAMEASTDDVKTEEDDMVEKLYSLQHYDSEEEDGPENFSGNIAGLSGLAYYASLDDDPYVTLKDVNPSDDEEEKEDFRILPTDNLLLVGRADEEVSSVEVHVFSEDDNHSYCHHDILIEEYPLTLEWLNFDPNQPEQTGNFVAIGTMSPVIEVWDLDLVNGPEPVYSLGVVKQKKLKKKKKKKEKVKVDTHTDSVLCLSWNKSVRSLLASASADNSVKLWDLSELKCILTLPHPDKVQSLQWHRYEHQLLATGCYDGVVRLFNCENQKMMRQWALGGEIEKVIWNHFDTDQLLASTEDSKIFCLNKDCDAPVFTIHAHNQAVTDISLSCQVPGLLVTCSSDDSIKFWDIQFNSPVFLHSKSMHMGAVLSAQFCIDSPYSLVVGGQKNGFNLVNVLSYPSLKDKCKEKGLLIPIEQENSDGKVDNEGMEDDAVMEVESTVSETASSSAAILSEHKSSRKHQKKNKKLVNIFC